MKKHSRKTLKQAWQKALRLLFVLIMLSGAFIVVDFARGQEPQTRDIFQPSRRFPGEHAHAWNVWDANSDDPRPVMNCAIKDWPSGLIEYCYGGNHEIGNLRDSVPDDTPWNEAPLIERQRGKGNSRELPTRRSNTQ